MAVRVAPALAPGTRAAGSAVCWRNEQPLCGEAGRGLTPLRAQLYTCSDWGEWARLWPTGPASAWRESPVTRTPCAGVPTAVSTAASPGLGARSCCPGGGHLDSTPQRCGLCRGLRARSRARTQTPVPLEGPSSGPSRVLPGLAPVERRVRRKTVVRGLGPLPASERCESDSSSSTT